MDSFELNKIIGAILGTLLFIMGIGFLAEAIYEPAIGSGPGYTLPEPSGDTAEAEPAAGQPAASIATLLASADAKQGEASAKKCTACHDFSKGGANKTGPHLYGIVGSKVADVEGYAFSDALKAHASETWTYENLNTWLTSPKAWAPGTKMTFAGIKDDAERANVIAYLSTLSDSPVPFPAPEAAAAPADSSAAAPTDTSAAAPADSSEAAPAATEATPAASSEAPVASPEAAPAAETAPASSEAAPAAAPAADATSAAPASELSSAAQ
jgi:cytochrome c